MTRAELARENYRMFKALGIIQGKSTEQEFVKRCLKGVGYAKPMSKAELESTYNNLLARM